MEYKVINKITKEIVRHAGFDIAVTEFTEWLFRKYIQEDKTIKVKYNYNYTNRQTIQFIQDGYIHEFSNIPVKMGMLDTITMQKELKGGE